MKQLHLNGKTITLIETAHVSKQSVDEVYQIIHQLNPDTICIELDEKRFNQLENPNQYLDQKLFDLIKEKKIWLVVINAILSSYQKKLANQTGSQVGGEMKMAMTLAKEKNKELVLMDRDVQTTFKRIWHSLGLKEKYRLFELLISSIFDKEEISEEQLESMKQSDLLESAISQLSAHLPSVSKVLVHERDLVMAHRIKHANGNNIVAVIGAAHSAGIQKALLQDYEIDTLLISPKPSLFSKVIKWVFPILIGVLIILPIGLNPSGLKEIGLWMLFVSIGSMIGSMIFLAHPITWLVAFITAPLSTLSPILSVGWFVGLSEAKIRAPKILDLHQITNDMTSIKKALNNNILRTLLIMISASLGSVIATLLFSIKAISSLFS